MCFQQSQPDWAERRVFILTISSGHNGGPATPEVRGLCLYPRQGFCQNKTSRVMHRLPSPGASSAIHPHPRGLLIHFPGNPGNVQWTRIYSGREIYQFPRVHCWQSHLWMLCGAKGEEVLMNWRELARFYKRHEIGNTFVKKQCIEVKQCISTLLNTFYFYTIRTISFKFNSENLTLSTDFSDLIFFLSFCAFHSPYNLLYLLTTAIFTLSYPSDLPAIHPQIGSSFT